MTLFPYKRQKVGDRLHVWVSRHFHYSDFGVRSTDDTQRYGHRFVCSGSPGSGFFERVSDSQSYHEYVRSFMSMRPTRYWNLLRDKEPNYERELQSAHTFMCATDDSRKRELMECYINALAIGRREEEMQRIIQGMKAKMGHHHNKYMVGIISHYQNKITQLERDMTAVEYQIEEHYSPEVYAAYTQMCKAFGAMVARCRRIWHYNEKGRGRFSRVFFDRGTFDFIRSKGYLPLMRDSKGTCYYWIPDAIIAARSSVDFDIVPLKNLTVVCQETAIAETTELLSSHIGDVACMILIPEMNLTFYFNHAHVVVDFVQAVDELKKML